MDRQGQDGTPCEDGSNNNDGNDSNTQQFLTPPTPKQLLGCRIFLGLQYCRSSYTHITAAHVFPFGDPPAPWWIPKIRLTERIKAFGTAVL